MFNRNVNKNSNETQENQGEFSYGDYGFNQQDITFQNVMNTQKDVFGFYNNINNGFSNGEQYSLEQSMNMYKNMSDTFGNIPGYSPTSELYYYDNFYQNIAASEMYSDEDIARMYLKTRSALMMKSGLNSLADFRNPVLNDLYHSDYYNGMLENYQTPLGEILTETFGENNLSGTGSGLEHEITPSVGLGLSDFEKEGLDKLAREEMGFLQTRKYNSLMNALEENPDFNDPVVQEASNRYNRSMNMALGDRVLVSGLVGIRGVIDTLGMAFGGAVYANVEQQKNRFNRVTQGDGILRSDENLRERRASNFENTRLRRQETARYVTSGFKGYDYYNFMFPTNEAKQSQMGQLYNERDTLLFLTEMLTNPTSYFIPGKNTFSAASGAVSAGAFLGSRAGIHAADLIGDIFFDEDDNPSTFGIGKAIGYGTLGLIGGLSGRTIAGKTSGYNVMNNISGISGSKAQTPKMETLAKENPELFPEGKYLPQIYNGTANTQAQAKAMKKQNMYPFYVNEKIAVLDELDKVRYKNDAKDVISNSQLNPIEKENVKALIDDIIDSADYHEDIQNMFSHQRVNLINQLEKNTMYQRQIDANRSIFAHTGEATKGGYVTESYQNNVETSIKNSIDDKKYINDTLVRPESALNPTLYVEEYGFRKFASVNDIVNKNLDRFTLTSQEIIDKYNLESAKNYLSNPDVVNLEASRKKYDEIIKKQLKVPEEINSIEAAKKFKYDAEMIERLLPVTIDEISTDEKKLKQLLNFVEKNGNFGEGNVIQKQQRLNDFVKEFGFENKFNRNPEQIDLVDKLGSIFERDLFEGNEKVKLLRSETDLVQNRLKEINIEDPYSMTSDIIEHYEKYGFLDNYNEVYASRVASLLEANTLKRLSDGISVDKQIEALVEIRRIQNKSKISKKRTGLIDLKESEVVDALAEIRDLETQDVNASDLLERFVNLSDTASIEFGQDFLLNRAVTIDDLAEASTNIIDFEEIVMDEIGKLMGIKGDGLRNRYLLDFAEPKNLDMELRSSSLSRLFPEGFDEFNTNLKENIMKNLKVDKRKPGKIPVDSYLDLFIADMMSNVDKNTAKKLFGNDFSRRFKNIISSKYLEYEPTRDKVFIGGAYVGDEVLYDDNVLREIAMDTLFNEFEKSIVGAQLTQEQFKNIVFKDILNMPAPFSDNVSISKYIDDLYMDKANRTLLGSQNNTIVEAVVGQDQIDDLLGLQDITQRKFLHTQQAQDVNFTADNSTILSKKERKDLKLSFNRLLKDVEDVISTRGKTEYYTEVRENVIDKLGTAGVLEDMIIRNPSMKGVLGFDSLFKDDGTLNKIAINKFGDLFADRMQSVKLMAGTGIETAEGAKTNIRTTFKFLEETDVDTLYDILGFEEIQRHTIKMRGKESTNMKEYYSNLNFKSSNDRADVLDEKIINQALNEVEDSFELTDLPEKFAKKNLNSIKGVYNKEYTRHDIRENAIDSNRKIDKLQAKLSVSDVMRNYEDTMDAKIVKHHAATKQHIQIVSGLENEAYKRGVSDDDLMLITVEKNAIFNQSNNSYTGLNIKDIITGNDKGTASINIENKKLLNDITNRSAIYKSDLNKKYNEIKKKLMEVIKTEQINDELNTKFEEIESYFANEDFFINNIMQDKYLGETFNTLDFEKTRKFFLDFNEMYELMPDGTASNWDDLIQVRDNGLNDMLGNIIMDNGHSLHLGYNKGDAMNAISSAVNGTEGKFRIISETINDKPTKSFLSAVKKEKINFSEKRIKENGINFREITFKGDGRITQDKIAAFEKVVDKDLNLSFQNEGFLRRTTIPLVGDEEAAKLIERIAEVEARIDSKVRPGFSKQLKESFDFVSSEHEHLGMDMLSSILPESDLKRTRLYEIMVASGLSKKSYFAGLRAGRFKQRPLQSDIYTPLIKDKRYIKEFQKANTKKSNHETINGARDFDTFVNRKVKGTPRMINTLSTREGYKNDALVISPTQHLEDSFALTVTDSSKSALATLIDEFIIDLEKGTLKTGSKRAANTYGKGKVKMNFRDLIPEYDTSSLKGKEQHQLLIERLSKKFNIPQEKLYTNFKKEANDYIITFNEADYNVFQKRYNLLNNFESPSKFDEYWDSIMGLTKKLMLFGPQYSGAFKMSAIPLVEGAPGTTKAGTINALESSLTNNKRFTKLIQTEQGVEMVDIIKKSAERNLDFDGTMSLIDNRVASGAIKPKTAQVLKENILFSHMDNSSFYMREFKKVADSKGVFNRGNEFLSDNIIAKSIDNIGKTPFIGKAMQEDFNIIRDMIRATSMQLLEDANIKTLKREANFRGIYLPDNPTFEQKINAAVKIAENHIGAAEGATLRKSSISGKHGFKGFVNALTVFPTFLFRTLPSMARTYFSTGEGLTKSAQFLYELDRLKRASGFNDSEIDNMPLVHRFGRTFGIKDDAGYVGATTLKQYSPLDVIGLTTGVSNARGAGTSNSRFSPVQTSAQYIIDTLNPLARVGLEAVYSAVGEGGELSSYGKSLGDASYIEKAKNADNLADKGMYWAYYLFNQFSGSVGREFDKMFRILHGQDRYGNTLVPPNSGDASIWMSNQINKSTGGNGENFRKLLVDDLPFIGGLFRDASKYQKHSYELQQSTINNALYQLKFDIDPEGLDKEQTDFNNYINDIIGTNRSKIFSDLSKIISEEEVNNILSNSNL